MKYDIGFQRLKMLSLAKPQFLLQLRKLAEFETFVSANSSENTRQIHQNSNLTASNKKVPLWILNSGFVDSQYLVQKYRPAPMRGKE